MVLGDLNADCKYITQNEWERVSLRKRTEFTWWIGDNVDTTVKRTNCAYDRWFYYPYPFLSL